MALHVSPLIVKNEDKSDLMNARERLRVALAELVPGKARNTGQVAHGKTSPPGPCWRFVQAAWSHAGSAACHGAASVLVAFVVVLALPHQAQARTLVSNLGQTFQDHGSLTDFDQAQAFTTGGNSGGYVLTSVQIDIVAADINPQGFTVSIHSNSGGAPGTNLGTLTNPASLAGSGVYTFSASGIALEASTTYWVVIDRVGALGDHLASIRNTASDGEDSGSASGWRIGNGSLYRNWNSSGSWTSFGDSKKIRVNGHILPTVSIANANANENDDFLMFDITLSRAAPTTVRVDFETTTGGTATEGRDYQPSAYTHVIRKGETTVPMGFELIEDSVADPGETVKARISNARLFDAYDNKIADLDITTDLATGTIYAPSTTTFSVSDLSMRIENASTREDNGWLRFKVKLSRKFDEYVCYDFETISGGTATEGSDYLKQPKVRHWIDTGEKVHKPFIRVLDDSVDDPGETVKVKISNARLCDDQSRKITITRAEATGTIRNTDPIPLAFLGRLGRTAAVQVVEQVEERMRAPRESGLQARLAGQELRRGMERDVGHHFLSRLQAAAGASRTGVDSPAPMDTQAGLAGDELRRLGLGSGDVLTGSALEMNRQTHQGGTVSFWVRGLESQFTGQEDKLSLKGGVRTTMLGADWAQGPLVAGLLLSHKGAVGDYSGVSAGEITSSLTGLHPWLGYQATERITLWGVTGYGRGALSVTPGAGATLDNGLSMAMAAGGLRGELVHSGVGGFGLAFKADALWVGTGTEGVISPTGNLAAVEATVTRFRAALETSRSYAFGRELSLQPSLEVGLRHDDGDAETGAGVDLAGSLIALNPLPGLSADVRVRTLLMHQAAGFQDRGVSVSFSYDPTPKTPLGLTARLAPSWGGQAQSGAAALWGRETMAGLARRPASGNRLEAELGYGQPVGRRLIGTPHFGVGASERGRDYRLGYSLTLSERSATNFEVGVDAQRRGSLSQGRVQHEVLGRITARW